MSDRLEEEEVRHVVRHTNQTLRTAVVTTEILILAEVVAQSCVA